MRLIISRCTYLYDVAHNVRQMLIYTIFIYIIIIYTDYNDIQY